jgi:hypothetical protein
MQLIRLMGRFICCFWQIPVECHQYATSAITIHQSPKVLYTFSEYFPTLPLLVHVFTAITMELFVCQENFFAMM